MREHASNRKTFRRDDQQESNKLDTTTLASKENGVRNSFCARRCRNEILYDEEKAYRNVIEKNREREKKREKAEERERTSFWHVEIKKKKHTRVSLSTVNGGT